MSKSSVCATRNKANVFNRANPAFAHRVAGPGQGSLSLTWPSEEIKTWGGGGRLGSSQRNPNPTLSFDLDGDVISCLSVCPCMSLHPSLLGPVGLLLSSWHHRHDGHEASPTLSASLCLLFQDCLLE